MTSTLSTTRPGAPPGSPPPRPVPGPQPPPRRRTGGVLLLPPWSRAPGLVWRQPMVVLAVLAAAAILGCAAGSSALFLSSAGAAAVQRGAGEYCPDATDVSIRVTAVPGQFAALDAAVTRASTHQGLPSPERLILSRSPDAGLFPTSSYGRRTAGLRLLYRDGALAQITPTSPRLPGAGVLLPADTAAALGARPGATIDLAGHPTRLVGTYRSLTSEPIRPFWCSTFRLFTPDPKAGGGVPPLAIATDPGTADAVMAAGARQVGEREKPTVLDDDVTRYSWFFPVNRGTLTIAQARDLLARDDRMHSELYGTLPPTSTLYEDYNDSPLLNRLKPVTDKAALIRRGLLGPILPVAVGGSLLALLMVGAAGSYWADRRIREVRLLASRGVGPVGLAGKALLELAAPAALGVLLGRWLAARLVTALGPSNDLEPYARAQADKAALVGLAGGLLLLGAVAGLRARNAVERPAGARRSRWLLVPWELTLLALAGWSWLNLRHSPGVVQVSGVAQPRLLLVSFPMVFLAGAALLAVRLTAGLLRPLRRAAAASTRMPTALYLAVGRITSAPAVSMLLLAALSLPAGMAVYAASITSSVQYTVQAKIRLFTGGQVALLAFDQIHRTPVVDSAGTIVRRYPGASTAQSAITVLAIDPDTFARWAYWDRRFAGPSLRTDLRRLGEAPAPGAPIPALAIRGRFQADVVPAGYQIQLGSRSLPIQVVDRPRYFPGTHDSNAIVVVSAANLPRIPDALPTVEVWGDDESALQHAVGDQIRVRAPVKLDSQIAITQANFAGLSYAFGYLTALAALVGVVAIGALLLYLETRQRTRVAAYAMSRRMGMPARTHLRSLLVELGFLAGFAVLLGTALAAAAAQLVYRRLEFNPRWSPPPALSVPVAALAGLGTATVVVALGASWYAHHAAARTKPAEILRLSE